MRIADIKTQADLDAYVSELNEDDFPYIGPVGSVILLDDNNIVHRYSDGEEIHDTLEGLFESIYSYYHDC